MRDVAGIRAGEMLRFGSDSQTTLILTSSALSSCSSPYLQSQEARDCEKLFRAKQTEIDIGLLTLWNSILNVLMTAAEFG